MRTIKITIIIIIIITITSHGNSWLQATLPIKSGGLGFRSASILAPSAFLASADGATDLMQQLLPIHLQSTPYLDRDYALVRWRSALPEDTPLPNATSQQKSWDRPSVQHLFDTLLSHCADDISRSRLLGAASSESGAWLNTLPVSSLGLRMSNDTVRIAIGLRVGAPLCLPHTCVCLLWKTCGQSGSPWSELSVKPRESSPPSDAE